MLNMIVLIAAIVIIGIFLMVKGAELLGWLFSKCGGIIGIALIVLSLIFWGFWATVIVILGIIAWWYLDNH